jgi:hypothetical protein
MKFFRGCAKEALDTGMPARGCVGSTSSVAQTCMHACMRRRQGCPVRWATQSVATAVRIEMPPHRRGQVTTGGAAAPARPTAASAGSSHSHCILAQQNFEKSNACTTFADTELRGERRIVHRETWPSQSCVDFWSAHRLFSEVVLARP